jgi:hypothetical protein
MLVLLDTGVLLRLFDRLDQVGAIVTLNVADFRRYAGVTSLSPADVLASATGP